MGIFLLQVWGGAGYLLNKILLWLSEHSKSRGQISKARKWRIAAWAVYLFGLPPWVIIFVIWRNWIAASVEASGAPAMLLGLVLALRGTGTNPPRWLDRLAVVCIPLGVGYSLWDFGGITTVNQWLEIGLVLGFLVGTYLLAKERAGGYLWYVLMHVACGWLMWIQGYPWLFLQQVVSLVFIADAWRTNKGGAELKMTDLFFSLVLLPVGVVGLALAIIVSIVSWFVRILVSLARRLK